MDKDLSVQIYEVQTPCEAETLVEIGVDTIGTVLFPDTNWKLPAIKETIDLVKKTASQSSLIPLFEDQDIIFAILDYYKPDIIHFCDDIHTIFIKKGNVDKLIQLQKNVKKRFPDIKIMRSIPIAQFGFSHGVPTIKLGKMFDESSDYLLTDTLLKTETKTAAALQPVNGFIGITGITCDWDVAAQLVEVSRCPVILAGGISPYNVLDGIIDVRPAGIDSCTNTNAMDNNGCPIRFKKDINKVKQLVRETQKAKQILERTIYRLSGITL